MKTSSTLFTSLLLGAGISASAQYTPVAPSHSSGLQNKLETELANRNLKGASATVIYPNNEIWSGASGMSHGMVTLNPDMVFGIGSITKSMVAATVLLLQEDSLLSVNDSLHQWLPAYPNINPNLTIKQLLQHRSGLYNYTTNTVWGNAVNSDFTAFWTADSVLFHYINPPIAAPGTTFGYSNTNYLLLGRIIEEATDSSWWDVLRQRILSPHNLESIYAEGIETRTGTFAHNWQVVSATNMVDLVANLPSQDAIFTSASSAGMMASKSVDVARFAELLFEGEILQQTSLDQMTQVVPFSGPIYSGYGFGMMRLNFQGNQIFGHGGNIPGFSAMMLYSPASGIAISMLINQDDDPVHMGLAMLQAAEEILISSPETQVQNAHVICYPNPASGNGYISLTTEKPGPVQVTLLNSLGQEVRQLFTGTVSAGNQTVEADLTGISSGIYFCQVKTAASTTVQRWVVK